MDASAVGLRRPDPNVPWFDPSHQSAGWTPLANPILPICCSHNPFARKIHYLILQCGRLVNQIKTVWHVRSRNSRKLSGTDGLKKGDNKQVFVSSYIVFPAANPCMSAALLMGKLSAANPMPLRLE
jgi:hypothetical protein